MRKSFDNDINNSLEKMARTNRDNVNQALLRETSYDARSTDYRRNGVMDFGALQIMSLATDIYFASMGDSGSSDVVGL